MSRRRSSTIRRRWDLGYVGVRAKDLGDWASYGPGLLGLQRVDKTRSSLAFRMDDRKQRIIVDADGGEGIGVFGWEVADAAALDALAARLEAAGTKVARGSRALADERLVSDLIVLNDPLGNRLEIFHGARGRVRSVRAGPLDLGLPHRAARARPRGVQRRERRSDRPLMPFYRDMLGFRLTDYYSHPFEAYFLHVNPRHHSLAFIQTGKNAVHHIMMEVFSFDDMGQGYDIALGERAASRPRSGATPAISSPRSTPGRRPASWSSTAGARARSIPRPGRPTSARKARACGATTAPGCRRSSRPRARNLRLQNAANGLRRPVQVMDGNYQLMPGVCPWWDGVKREQKAG